MCKYTHNNYIRMHVHIIYMYNLRSIHAICTAQVTPLFLAAQ